MNSPRKLAARSGSASPRENVASSSSTTEPRASKIDQAQLTPRQRRPLEFHSAKHLGMGTASAYLPDKVDPSSVTNKTTTLAQLSVNKPKAAPRLKSVEAVEMTAEIDVNVDKKETSTNKRHENERGSGDDILRVPLEGLSKLEIKNELKTFQRPLGMAYSYDDEEEQELEEDEKNVEDAYVGPDRARFNIWKGKNYDLHQLGSFKSEFDKRVHSFQRPNTEPVYLDPHCRNENGLTEEPVKADAFLIWKCKSNLKWKNTEENEPTISSQFSDSNWSNEDDNSVEKEDVENGDDGDSLPDPDMMEYISSQQQKKEQGQNITGETLYYDADYDIVRNLHRDSYSLTNYGVMPDDKWIGKGHLFYPEITEAEKKMLKAQDPTSNKKLGSLSPRIAVVRRNNQK